ncbi:MAG: ribonuclease J [Chloroflexota bacterium]|nr:MAG: ribonuclease J [Chloroflexota bacterium]
MAKPNLRIIPLGGCGEIGKNMTVIELGSDAIIIDTGVMFPANDMLGVDYIIPDFRYLLERDDLTIHGILYTHGHEDHTGAVAHVIEALRGVPIYATPLTAALLEVKLRGANLEQETTINVFEAGDVLHVGPFKVESFHQCHSIPDCVGFGINTPHGLIVHSGDYKFDNTPIDGKKPDYAKLAEFSRRGVLLLMGDSTNAEIPGWTPSEQVVTEAFDRVFREAKGRIIIATFASHISRIQQVANFAAKYGRKLAIAGHSMTENVKMARKMNLLQIDDDRLIDVQRISSVPPHEIVVMATGSQGEPSAVLGRLATGQHRHMDVWEGDTIVLSAHTIPGNEESVSRTINRLFQRGANVLYDPIAPVHVSGHARQEEMKLLMSLLSPKFFMPVHGELRHLKAHARLAQQMNIPEENIVVVENGVVVEVDRHSIRLGERVPGGYVFVDGSGVGDVGKTVMRDREILARDGFLMVVVNVDSQGRMLGEPEIISRGFIYLRNADELIEQVKNVVSDVLIQTRASRNGKRRERLQESISRTLYNETKRRPMVFTVINEH